MGIKGRVLDGHVSRVLEGKTIERVTKDGHVLTIHCTNGERWNIAWANPNTGEGIAGEPCLVTVDVNVLAPAAVIFGSAGAV